jgi:hypothetical protein
MPTLTARRATAELAAIGALSIAALATTPEADASTLYACVKKNGTAHIYAKKPKCKKHETRLSWNSQGPAGRNGNGSSGSNGSSGIEGKAGANGAVAGFAVGETNSIDLAGVFFAQIPGMSKQLPPGSFIASAYIDLHASTNAGGGEAGVICSLIDTPTGGGFGVFNQGIWHSAISAPSFAPFADGQISIHLAFSAGSPSTVSVACGEFQSAGTNLSINTSFGAIVAVQTTTNS